ncbi:hypothetical protein HanXRQr2_Chr16g0747741 [Helianthus annuus]|uniref:Uncharacterized protein n=1 Tax=Helianthus annuus TaxID=4232 RepID=A0A9K3DQT0_HELAN|nr:hypothetical protein HanXRQr2_Chr16g0747741 [Helianthus annuus]KAJ0821166.1 hypothetical protein HanPSC8_Chr16g0716821 [Helianthus annuus]
MYVYMNDSQTHDYLAKEVMYLFLLPLVLYNNYFLLYLSNVTQILMYSDSSQQNPMSFLVILYLSGKILEACLQPSPA